MKWREKFENNQLVFLRTRGPRKRTQISPHCIQVSETFIGQINDYIYYDFSKLY